MKILMSVNESSKAFGISRGRLCELCATDETMPIIKVGAHTKINTKQSAKEAAAMAKKASTKHQNRILASLSILLILGSSVPVGAVGAWMMKIIGAVAILILLVSLCRMPVDEDERGVKK